MRGVGMAGEGFRVAGIGEVEAVGDAGDGALVAVAKDGSLCGEEGPEERHKFCAALVSGRCKELLLQLGVVAAGVKAVPREQGFVGATKELLPAQGRLS